MWNSHLMLNINHLWYFYLSLHLILNYHLWCFGIWNLQNCILYLCLFAFDIWNEFLHLPLRVEYYHRILVYMRLLSSMAILPIIVILLAILHLILNYHLYVQYNICKFSFDTWINFAFTVLLSCIISYVMFTLETTYCKST